MDFWNYETPKNTYYIFILYLQLTNSQLKTDIILYTNKNSYVLIIKKHANSRQLLNFKACNKKLKSKKLLA